MTQMGLVALAGTLMGVLPLVLGAFYAIAPTEQRLALMRPLSLATIFAAVSASALGLLNVLRGLTLRGGDGSLADLSRMSATGMAESLSLRRLRLSDGRLAVRGRGALAASVTVRE